MGGAGTLVGFEVSIAERVDRISGTQYWTEFRGHNTQEFRGHNTQEFRGHNTKFQEVGISKNFGTEFRGHNTKFQSKNFGTEFRGHNTKNFGDTILLRISGTQY